MDKDRDNDEVIVSAQREATEQEFQDLLAASPDMDERSKPTWVRFTNGDLGLVIWPTASYYEELVYGENALGI